MGRKNIGRFLIKSSLIVYFLNPPKKLIAIAIDCFFSIFYRKFVLIVVNNATILSVFDFNTLGITSKGLEVFFIFIPQSVVEFKGGRFNS